MGCWAAGLLMPLHRGEYCTAFLAGQGKCAICNMCPFRHPLCLRNSSPSLGLDSDLSPIMRFRRRQGPQDRRASLPTCLLLAHFFLFHGLGYPFLRG